MYSFEQDRIQNKPARKVYPFPCVSVLMLLLWLSSAFEWWASGSLSMCLDESVDCCIELSKTGWNVACFLPSLHHWCQHVTELFQCYHCGQSAGTLHCLNVLESLSLLIFVDKPVTYKITYSYNWSTFSIMFGGKKILPDNGRNLKHVLNLNQKNRNKTTIHVTDVN